MVNGLCYQFLARSRFTQNQDGQVIGYHAGDGAIHLLHGGRTADKRQSIVFIGKLFLTVIGVAFFDKASVTARDSSFRSKGFGRYSNAPFSVARIAVLSVFCAERMMTLMPGYSDLLCSPDRKWVVLGIGGW